MNVLSFDIEEWFHPEIFNGRFSPDEWSSLESRVVPATEIILNFLSRKKLTATFFVLGWVAEKYPELVKRIDAEGHEIGSHGYSHRMITQMTPDEFREDLHKSIKVLQNISQQAVLGFRAPTFSVTNDTLWSLPIMLSEGIRYDSSVFPIYHDRYGIPEAPKEPYVIFEDDSNKLFEFPMTTVQVSKYSLPCSGGGYFRLLPYTVSKFLMKKAQRIERPVIFYAHPWEFDVGLPKVNLGKVGSLRHYNGISKFLKRLDALTDEMPFSAFRDATQFSEKLT